MKRKIFSAVLLCFAVFAVSCSKEQVTEKQEQKQDVYTVKVALPELDNVKSTLGPAADASIRKLFWCSGDVININGVVSEPLGQIDDSCTEADFSFSTQLEYPYNIIYPASMLVDDKLLLPSMQKYQEGTFASGAFPAVCRVSSANKPAKLESLATVVKVSICAEGSYSLARVYLAGRNGEQISGLFNIGYSSATLNAASGDASSKFVGVDCGSLPLGATPVDIYVVVPANTYSSGLRLKLIDVSGNCMDVSKEVTGNVSGGRILCLPTISFAPTSVVDDPDNPVFKERFSGGSGTEADPYIISTPADLAALSTVMGNDNGDYKSLHYRQSCDIDMSGYNSFKPIGISSDLDFRGNYDGQGHKISNLKIIYNGAEPRATALFGNCGPGSVLRNISLDDITVESSSYCTASIVGYMNGGLVSNCSFTGSVYGTGANGDNVSYLGGIAGRSSNGSVFENCTSAGNVTTTSHHAGGIVGEADTGITIRDCRFVKGCSLSGKYYMGGIIGYLKADASNSISGCVCEGSVYSSGTNAAAIAAFVLSGNISDCMQSSTSTVMARLNYVGGIVACAYPDAGFNVTINKCSAYGDVTGQYEVGGIVGRMQARSDDSGVIVSNCARIGGLIRATGVDAYNYNIAGGIAGWAQGDGTCRIINSFSKGISIDGMVEGVGGFSGIVAVDNAGCGSITNVYSDILASDITYEGGPVAGSSLNYHGAIIARNMTNPRTVTNAFYDISYRLGPSSEYSSHQEVSCAALTADQMKDGTLLASLNSGKEAASSDIGGSVPMLSWKAGADGYPVLDGVPVDTSIPEGKKLRVSIIGDSISSFAGWHPSPYTNHYPNNNADVKAVDDTWWYALATKYMKNAKIDMNISFSNTTVTRNLFGDATQYWYGYDFCTRFIQCHGMGNPDVIVIHGGTNDYVHYYGEKLAADIDMRSSERPSDEIMNELYAAADACTTLEQAEALCYDTFCESYIKLVKMMKLRYPGVKIVCIAGDWLTGGLEQSVLHIADHYGCKSVDFVQLAGYHKTGEPLTKYSGCHPDKNGMDYMARTIYELHGDWMENE